MKFYHYDKNKFCLETVGMFKHIKNHYIFFIMLSILISFSSIQLFRSVFLPNIPLKEIIEVKDKYEKITIAETQYEFTEDEFIVEIKRLNLKYPHIVYAQAIIESGNFSSKIFKENNNMFGMKQARSRINLAKSTQYGHAYFETWEDCLLDFAFHRATYFSKLRSEADIYAYLGKYYAEDPDYINKLKTVVNKYKLKDKFK